MNILKKIGKWAAYIIGGADRVDNYCVSNRLYQYQYSDEQNL